MKLYIYKLKQANTAIQMPETQARDKQFSLVSCSWFWNFMIITLTKSTTNTMMQIQEKKKTHQSGGKKRIGELKDREKR